MNENKDQYCRLALTYDDFLFDEKNPSGGKVVSEPLGTKWSVRFSKNRFLFSSTGNFNNLFEVEFPDSVFSPDRSSFSNKNDEITVWLYYFFKAGHIAEFNFYHYFFRQKETFYEQTSDYDYRDYIYDFAVKYYHQLHKTLIIKGFLHFVRQEAEAEGQRNYDFKRNEILPKLILQFSEGRSLWEIGYIRSSYKLNLDDALGTSSYSRSNSFQTLMIRWTYMISDFARLQFSLSHVPDFDGFGGGNLNFLLHY